MAVAFVQVGTGSRNGVFASSQTANYASAQTAGNANVVFLYLLTGTEPKSSTPSISDTKLNTYVQIGNGPILNYGDGSSLYAWAAFNIAAATAGANTVTCTWSPGDNLYTALWITEYSGVNQIEPNSITPANAQALTGTAPAATITTLAANSVLLSFCRINTGTLGVGTQTQRGSTTLGTAIAELATTTVGAYTPTFSGSVNCRWGVATIGLSPTSIGFFPSLTIQAATSITQTTCTLNGTITVQGTAASTTWGFNYGLTTAYGSQVSTTGTLSTGSFSLNLTGLTAGQIYHFQAFATNSVGTGTSVDGTFVLNDPIGIPTYVQSAVNDPNLSSTSLSVTFANAQTAGNTNLVWFLYGSNGDVMDQVVDTAGNVYYMIATTTGAGVGATMWLWASIGIKSSAAGSNTVTARMSSSQVCKILIAEYTNVVEITHANGFGSAASPINTTSIAPINTFNNNDVIVSTVFWNVGGPSLYNTDSRTRYTDARTVIADQVLPTASNTTLTFWNTNASSPSACQVGLTATNPRTAFGFSFLTPPMSFETWRNFNQNCTEAQAKACAAGCVTNGILAAGYKYFDIGDAMYNSRVSGNLVVNANYPDGDTATWNYIKGQGFIPFYYLAPGTTGCNFFQTSAGFESTDAALAKTQGAVLVFYDSCTNFGTDAATITAYQTMTTQLNSRGISMYVSDAQYGNHSWTWGPNLGPITYTEQDAGTSTTWATLKTFADSAYRYAGGARPNKFFIPDFLGIGNSGLNDAQGRSQMALWCVMGFPLTLSNDPRGTIPSTTLATLTNSEVISVNQDVLALGGTRYKHTAAGTDFVDVYAKQLQGGEWALVLWNRDTAHQNISVSWTDFGAIGPFQIRDLWGHTNLGIFSNGYTTVVPAYDNAMLLLSNPLSPRAPVGLYVTRGNVASWTDIEPAFATISFQSASDPYFSQNLSSTPISQILPPGYRTLNVPVPNKWYRVQVSRGIGVAYSNTFPQWPPATQSWNTHGIKPVSGKNIQYAQTIQSNIVNSGTVSSATVTLSGVNSIHLLVARISWQDSIGNVVSIVGNSGNYQRVPGALTQGYLLTTDWWFLPGGLTGSESALVTLDAAHPGVNIELTEISPWEIYTRTNNGVNTAPDTTVYYPGGPNWNSLNVVQEYVKQFSTQNIYLTLPHPKASS